MAENSHGLASRLTRLASEWGGIMLNFYVWRKTPILIYSLGGSGSNSVVDALEARRALVLHTHMLTDNALAPDKKNLTVGVGFGAQSLMHAIRLRSSRWYATRLLAKYLAYSCASPTIKNVLRRLGSRLALMRSWRDF